MEMALVDLETALDLVVLDPDDLDAELTGEAPGDPRAEDLRRDGGVGQAAGSSRASPS
jgi:hypothetical protein